MKSKDFTPLILWLWLFAGIISLAFVRSIRMTGIWNGYLVNFDNVFIGLYILWMLIELRVSIEDVNTEGKKTSDSTACLLYASGQALTFFTALWFRSVWRVPNIAHFAGIALFVLGVCYRLWAIRTLGQFYSHRVQTVHQHRVVASGPYRFTRHPAYAGMIVANVGISVYFLNCITICVFLFILLPGIFLRIKVEERTLVRVDEYSEFAEKRKRLCPGVW